MTASPLGRRDFFRTAARGCALLLAGAGEARIWTRARAQETLRIALVSSPAEGAGSVARGVALGVEEAARTGELVGRRIELLRAEGDAEAERLVREERVAALIVGGDEAAVRALGELADSAGILVVNAGSTVDSLRGAECRRSVFHVEASEAMYRAALAARSGGAAEATEAVLWHPALERFGAAQLGDRFRARFGAGMDGPAWAGWMAVKVVWEAHLRARSTESAALRAYLERGATQFDGHKGWPLSFRAWDHQLRQPLYLVSHSAGGETRLVGEVPAARPADGGPSSAELLDRLGGDASTSTCRHTIGETP